MDAPHIEGIDPADVAAEIHIVVTKNREAFWKVSPDDNFIRFYEVMVGVMQAFNAERRRAHQEALEPSLVKVPKLFLNPKSPIG